MFVHFQGIQLVWASGSGAIAKELVPVWCTVRIVNLSISVFGYYQRKVPPWSLN